jgi:hypothetical protein
MASIAILIIVWRALAMSQGHPDLPVKRELAPTATTPSSTGPPPVGGGPTTSIHVTNYGGNVNLHFALSTSGTGNNFVHTGFQPTGVLFESEGISSELGEQPRPVKIAGRQITIRAVNDSIVINDFGQTIPIEGTVFGVEPQGSRRTPGEAPQTGIIQKLPHLKCHGPDSMGLYSILERACAYGIRVTNDESRYYSTAHNICASIHLKHVLGDEQRVACGVWLDDNTHLIDKVTLGMGEQKWLLLLFWDAHAASAEFRAANQIPLDFGKSPALEFGQWTVELALTGDNVSHQHTMTLTLQPRGGIICT